MNQYFAVIQARMGSSRFPGKVMQPIGEYKSVIEFLVERLKHSQKINEIVLATSYNPENDILEAEAKRLGIHWTRGEEEDVMRRVLRYFCYFEENNLTRQSDNYSWVTNKKPVIIDITADCPFVCPFMIDQGIMIYENNNCEYVSNIMTRSWPDGFDFQIYDASLLNHLYDCAKMSEKHYEHTGWNILNYNQHLFEYYKRPLKMVNMGASSMFFHPDWGLTLDTEADLKLISTIHLGIKDSPYLKEKLRYKSNGYSAQTIIGYLNMNPKLLQINKQVTRNIPGV